MHRTLLQNKITKVFYTIADILYMETIKTITEVDDIYSGYKIVTDKQEILILIDAETQCCENWGYLSLQDCMQEFIGAALWDIEITITDLQSLTAKYGDSWLFRAGLGDIEYAEAVFVTLKTSQGDLQFTVYNEHYGAYGHRVKVTAKEIDFSSLI